MENLFKTRPDIADYRAFYAQLFAPVEEALGPLDKDTLVAIVGFPHGGPVNLCTVGAERGDEFITYVSCELTTYEGQKPSTEGPFEVLVSCNDEKWARIAVSAAGEVSFEASLDAGHTIDIGIKVDAEDRLQGLVFERFSVSRIGGKGIGSLRVGAKDFGILRAIGVTRRELEWCLEHGAEALIGKLKLAGVYPRSDVKRESVV